MICDLGKKKKVTKEIKTETKHFTDSSGKMLEPWPLQGKKKKFKNWYLYHSKISFG